MAQKPKKNDGKKPYFYAGSSGMGVKPKDASKASKTASKNWNALTPSQKKKVIKDMAVEAALWTAPYGKAAKTVSKGVKAVNEARKVKKAQKFLNELKKNGVAVSKPSSPFIGMTNAASARSARLRAEKAGNVTNIKKWQKKRKGNR